MPRGLRCAHQRRRRRSERAFLREADELVAGLGPVPAFGHGVGRADTLRQQRAQQAQPELAGRDAFVALRVFVDDRVHARLTGAAGLAEGDFLARDVLQFDRDVLEHVAEPRPLVFAHAPEESAGLAVGAAMLGEPGKRCGERVDECAAEPARGPGLERP